MDMKEKISEKELKSFALSMSWAIPALFMLLLPWIFDQSIHWWPALVSLLLLTFYFIFPKGIYLIYKSWMAIASVLGWINTRIILALVFYGIIFPIGVLLRLFGKLQYKNSEPEEHASYWKTRDVTLKKEDLERPF